MEPLPFIASYRRCPCTDPVVKHLDYRKEMVEVPAWDAFAEPSRYLLLTDPALAGRTRHLQSFRGRSREGAVARRPALPPTSQLLQRLCELRTAILVHPGLPTYRRPSVAGCCREIAATSIIHVTKNCR